VPKTLPRIALTPGEPAGIAPDLCIQLALSCQLAVLADPELLKHLPLKEISAAITPETLNTVIQLLDKDLRLRFGIENPRILVCGLNPHAGENG